MKDIFKSGDVIGSTRCFIHGDWGLPCGATWQETLEKAIVIAGSYIDIGMDDPVEWSRELELAVR